MVESETDPSQPEEICEIVIKITCGKTVLSDKPFAIMCYCSLLCCTRADKMDSIHRTNGVLEKGIELWIAENVRRTGISASWLVDEVGVEGFG
jgi:hypothetical protein